jgi:hypothetical protein
MILSLSVHHQLPLALGENGEKTLPIAWPMADLKLLEQLSDVLKFRVKHQLPLALVENGEKTLPIAWPTAKPIDQPFEDPIIEG